MMSAITVDGTTDFSGSGTVAGTGGKQVNMPSGDSAIFSLLNLVSTISAGTPALTVSGGTWGVIGPSFNMMFFDGSITGGVPVFTISAAIQHHGTRFGMAIFNVGSVAAGTFSISGAIKTINLSKGVSNPFRLLSVSGGTWTVTSAVDYTDDQDVQATFVLHQGTGGTFTISGAMVCKHIGLMGPRVQVTGAGTPVVSVTGTHTVIGGRRTAVWNVVQSLIGAGGTAALTGIVRFRNLLLEAGTNVLNAIAGTTVSGPSSLTFENCIFNGAVVDATGAGTLTWAAATWRYKECHLDALFTFSGTRFSVMEHFNTVLNGDTVNKAITATGTRPATYRMWKCTFSGGLYDDLKPEVINASHSIAGAAAFTRGQLVRIDATPNAAAQTAGTINAGAVLADTAGAGVDVTIVTDGRVFVDVAAGVVAGDGLKVDAAGTPTQAITSALGALVLGQTVGTALEATGATNAGEAYSEVHTR
jgi:hypothetical protein